MKTEDAVAGIRRYTSSCYDKSEHPALLKQEETWRGSRPLDGVRILDATPLFRNTLLKYVPLLVAGAELTVATCDGIPYDPGMVPLLEAWGIPHRHQVVGGEYDCILDCGGKHAALTASRGVGELTRSGYYHYGQAACPVIMVDDSRTKTIETCLGTGNGFYRGMQALGYGDLGGKGIVLFGYGKVGRGIAYYARKADAVVTVVDRASVRVPPEFQHICSDDAEGIAKAVSGAWCVVTATGIANAMVGNGAAECLRHGTQLVAAMGIEDEWGNALPKERLLNHGEPLNFLLPEPTLLRYIDPTMALSNASALELVTQALPAGIQKIRPEVEAEIWTAVEACGVISGEMAEAGL